MSYSFAALSLLSALLLGQADDSVVHDQPPVRVRQVDRRGPDGNLIRAHQLMYYETNWGFNNWRPDNRADWGNPEKDLSRLPTTYYHPGSPVGLAFQNFNWFADAPNHNASDARIVASLIGLGGQPHRQLAALWSEPPVAVLGMSLATEAGYARPFQTMHFFERNVQFVELSQPKNGDAPLFTYLRDARERGAAVKVFPGEHRATFAKHGGERFYHLIVVETIKESTHQHLHADLLTRQAMQMLMSNLVDDGVLCFHTSNRFVRLEKVIASVAKNLGYACLEGRDPGDYQSDPAHFSSSWVLVARRAECLEPLKRRTAVNNYWHQPETSERWVWRDGDANSMAGLWMNDPYIADADNYVRRLEVQLARFVGFVRARQLTIVLRFPLGSLHRVALLIRNGT